MRNRSKNILTTAAGAFVTAVILGMGMEAHSASARSVNEPKLDPAKRHAAAINTSQIEMRRTKTASDPRIVTATPPSHIAARLQRTLSVEKTRGRSVGKVALLDDTQRRALHTLNATAQDAGGVRAHFDTRNGTVAFLKPQGRPLTIDSRALSSAPNASMSASTVGQQFLTEQRELFKLDDPRAETRVTEQRGDVTGRGHVRLQQVYQGVPVWGQELLVHTQGSNGVYLVQGSYVPTPRHLDVSADIDVKKAEAAARMHLRLPTEVPAQSELVIYAGNKFKPALTYKVEIAPSLDERWIYFINAHNGKVVHRINNIHKNVVSASGTDLQGVTRTFNAWSQGGQFYAIDPSTPSADVTYNPLSNGPNHTGDTFILDARNGDGTQLYDNTSTGLNSGWDRTLVSAAYNTRAVYDYYKNTFARDSMDGKGKNLLVVTRFERAYANAFWNGTYMVYGDGDGQIFGPLAGCLDVAAHEMTHGVIEHSANLIYENQSGALNESFADIFAAMVDGDDWTIGENCTLAAPGYLRNMKTPSLGLSKQPTRMSEYVNLPNTEAGDHGGVHINSGIPNRAAYLIAEGLSVEGLGNSIGRAKAGQIFYRALTTYLTASAQFVDARRATIQSAEDLYGVNSPEVQAVTAAWDAVEVTDDNRGTPAPVPVDPVSGEDVMVYLYPQDGTYDNLNEPFHVYIQIMDRPFTGYDPAKDLGPINNVAATGTRPAVYTKDSTTWVIYVGVDNNLYMVDAVTGTQGPILQTGNISSIATSLDGRYVAYTTTDSTDNTVWVLDLENPASSKVVPLIPRSYQEGDAQAGTIFYADALAFDYTGRNIVFDMLSCIPLPSDPCTVGGGGYHYWSVATMNVVNGQVLFPFADQNPAIDLSYPSFAANHQSVIALDYQDWTNVATSGIASRVITMNLETQEQLTIHEFGFDIVGHYGLPSFWGGDDYLTLQNGTLAQRAALNSDWGPKEGTALELLNNFIVAMPVMHRTGQRALTGGLGANSTLLDFGQVASGGGKTLTLTLTNAGNSDVNITNIVLDGAAFRHNATNTRVPRGTSLPVTVTFTPTTVGTQTGTLTFFSDGNPSNLVVTFSGTAFSNTPPPTTVQSGGGGGGAFDPWSIPLLVIVMAWLLASGKRKGGFLGR